jgi:hypothetical protein
MQRFCVVLVGCVGIVIATMHSVCSVQQSEDRTPNWPSWQLVPVGPQHVSSVGCVHIAMDWFEAWQQTVPASQPPVHERHFPAEQAASLQTVPHAPQLSTSVVVSTHPPSHTIFPAPVQPAVPELVGLLLPVGQPPVA